MLSGEKMSFADEAYALFGIRPELKPLSDYDPILARIDALVPGTGPLTPRIAAFKTGFVIPKDRLEPVIAAAIAECRRRTAEHIALPANERFTLAFVGDKPWSGYNYYLGTRPRRSRSTPTSRSTSTGRSIWAATRATPATTSTTPCWSGPSSSRRAGSR
jgi:hypothetical protein